MIASITLTIIGFFTDSPTDATLLSIFIHVVIPSWNSLYCLAGATNFTLPLRLKSHFYSRLTFMITSTMLRTLFSSFPYLVHYFNIVVIEEGCR